MNIRLKIVALLFSVFLTPAALASESVLRCGSIDEHKTTVVNVEAQPVAMARSVSPLGANMHYFTEDDDAWESGLAAKLKPLALSSLRFPGGEYADRYNWERGGDSMGKITLRAGNIADEPARFTNHVEFLRHAETIGVKDIYFIANLEGAFLEPGNRADNIQRYAEKAAKWVAEVKRRGYQVKYWEIGNESNHSGTTFPLTAHEYAGALITFSRAMKQADPGIIIAANGPANVGAPGFADKLTQKQLVHFRGGNKKLCGSKPKDDCIEKLRRVIPGVAQPRSWWEVVAEEAGRDFDMEVIHSYSRMVLSKSSGSSGLKEMRQVRQLRKELERMTGKGIRISVTEWNVPPERQEIVSNSEAALSNIIKLGMYKAAGVEHAHIWPLRYPGLEGGGRVLLTMDKLEETSMYHAFEAAAPILNANYAGQEVLENGVYVLKTVSATGERVALVNIGDRVRSIRLKIEDTRNHVVQVYQLSGYGMSGGEVCSGSGISDSIDLSLPPGSLTTAVLTH